jgi:hypothetical protein
VGLFSGVGHTSGQQQRSERIGQLASSKEDHVGKRSDTSKPTLAKLREIELKTE